VTIVAMSYMVVEALQCGGLPSSARYLMRAYRPADDQPLDWEAVFRGVRKRASVGTGYRCPNRFCGRELVARVTMECWSSLKQRPQRIAMPDIPEPPLRHDAWPAPRAEHVVQTVNEMLGDRSRPSRSMLKAHPHDVPGDCSRVRFSGPSPLSPGPEPQLPGREPTYVADAAMAALKGQTQPSSPIRKVS